MAIAGGWAELKNNVVSENQASEQYAGGITLHNITAASLVDGNTITKNTGAGDRFALGGIYVLANSAVVTISNNMITNNEGKTSGWNSIGLFGASGILVNNNVENVVIDGNTLSGHLSTSSSGNGAVSIGVTDENDIYTSKGYAEVKNNIIKDNNVGGLFILNDTTRASSISNNQILNNKGDGIQIAVAGPNLKIQNNNQIIGNQGVGINIKSGTAITIGCSAPCIGNTIQNNTLEGIAIALGGSGSIVNNTVTGNGTQGGNGGVFIQSPAWTVNNNNLYLPVRQIKTAKQ